MVDVYESDSRAQSPDSYPEMNKARMLGNCQSRASEYLPLSPWWHPAFSTKVVLALVIWIAHFLHSARFGLYEDDWYRVPKAMEIDWHGLWALIRVGFTSGASQGRPLHPAFIYFFSFVGFKCGGLHSVYVISSVVLFVNALLFQSLLIKAFHDHRFAFLGALAFCVFPADTTQPFLTHGLGLQPAITLLLISFHCYLAGRIKTSYLVILLALFTYETPFLVFAAAPLLRPRLKNGMLKHSAILGGILLSVIILRAVTAETRVSQIGARDVLLGCLNVVSGPIVCLAMCVYRPVETLGRLTWQDVSIVSVCILALICIFIAPFGGDETNVRAARDTAGTCVGQPKSIERRRLLFGLAALMLAYPLTLTTTGFAVAGRGTRAHTSAIVGASVLFAWTCSCLLSLPVRKVWKYAPVLFVACSYGLLIGFGLRVQRDYVLGWQEQHRFWIDLVALCPSLEDGDVILVEPRGLRDTRQLLFFRKDLTGIPDTRQIKSLDTLYDVLPELYDFPAEWREPPRVFRLPLNWEGKLFYGDDELRLLTIEAGYSYFPDTRSTVQASHVIFLDTGEGHLTRRSFIRDVGTGELLHLKSDSGSPAKIAKTPFFRYLISAAD